MKLASLTISALLCAVPCAALLAAPPLPETLSPPKGLNLGSTSFFDAFGRETAGFSLVEYDRYETLNSLNGPNGQPSPLFKGTDIQVAVALTQLIYTTNLHPFGDNIAFSAALPVVDLLNSSFAPDSIVKLNNNGTNIGDLVWGPIYQSKIYLRDGHPYFVWRFQFIVSSPTGALNEHKSINQGTGYWAINPYVAFTYLPVPKLEFSTRFNYQYNFPGSQFSNPPPIPHLAYVSGQGGQIIYDNFATSYNVVPKLNLGLDGYFLDQLTSDRTNGQIVPKSRETEVYIGPGAHIKFGESDFLNLNTYFKLVSNNATSGPQFNLQYIHRF